MRKSLVIAATIFITTLVSSSAYARSYIREETIITTSQAPYCREFTQTFTIGGQTQTGVGTACLQADGSWEIPSSSQRSIRYITRNERVYYVPVKPYHRAQYRHDNRWYSRY